MTGLPWLVGCGLWHSEARASVYRILRCILRRTGVIIDYHLSILGDLDLTVVLVLRLTLVYNDVVDIGRSEHHFLGTADVSRALSNLLEDSR